MTEAQTFDRPKKRGDKNTNGRAHTNRPYIDIENGGQWFRRRPPSQSAEQARSREKNQPFS
jgi:hypothetical protein